MTSTHEDDEAHPLLDEERIQSDQLADTYPSDEIEVESRVKRKRNYVIKYKINYFAIFLLLLLFYGTFKIRGNLPEREAIQQSMIDISNVEIQGIHLDGWRTQNSINTKNGKALQVTANLKVSVNYTKWLQETDDNLTYQQKRFIKNMNENVLHSICISINNFTTIDTSVNRSLDNNVIGSLIFLTPICIRLENEFENNIQVTFLIETNIRRIVSVLKKIWVHDYNNIHIQSLMSVKLSKHLIPFVPINIPFMKLSNLLFNWENLIDMNNIDPFVVSFQDAMDSLSILDLVVSDIPGGFHSEIQMSLPNLLKDIELVDFDKKMEFPEINWDIFLKDCDNDFSVELSNLFFRTPQMDLTNYIKYSNQENITIFGEGDVIGALPNELLYKVCYSDEENIITPMTRIINEVLNISTVSHAMVRGSTIFDESTNYELSDSSSLVPQIIVQEFLDEMGKFEMTTNISVDANKLIKDFTIQNVAFKRTEVESKKDDDDDDDNNNGKTKLSLVGRLKGLLDLSFYETEINEVNVEQIKGKVKLYHNDKHFVTTNMNVWKNATSKIVHIFDEEKDTNATMMELLLDINDDNVEVVNRFEATKVFNKLLFFGKALVHARGNLDLMLNGTIGEMVITRMNCENDILITK